MNKKILNKLLLCTLILSVTAPVFDAAELSSEATSETSASEVVSSEETSEVVASESADSEVATSEVVASESADSEAVLSEDVDSEVVASDDSEKSSSSLYLSGSIYLGDENTNINESVDGQFSVNVSSLATLQVGSTITIAAPAGIEISNIVVTDESNDDAVLVEGTDYSLENNVITILTETAPGHDIGVSYSAKMLNATTDILGATTSMFVDVNENEQRDEGDYSVMAPGIDIVVEDGDLTDTRYALFESEIVGGALSAENTNVTRSYKDGVISGEADYTITNSGDFAVEVMSIYENFNLISDSDAYYVYGSYTSFDDAQLSVDGSSYMTRDEFKSSRDSSTSEYLNPGDELKVKIPFTINQEMTEANLAEYDFGSWENFTKHAKAEFTIEMDLVDNIFGQELTDTQDIVLTDSLYEGSTEDTTDKDTSTDEDTSTDVVADDNDDSAADTTKDTANTQTKSDDESKAMSLATTGSAVIATVMLLTGALLIAFVAKFKVLTK